MINDFIKNDRSDTDKCQIIENISETIFNLFWIHKTLLLLLPKGIYSRSSFELKKFLMID